MYEDELFRPQADDPAPQTPAEDVAPAEDAAPAEELVPGEETPVENAGPAEEAPVENAGPAEETPAAAAPVTEEAPPEAAARQEGGFGSAASGTAPVAMTFPAKKRRRGFGWLKVAGLVAVCALVGCVSGIGGAVLGQRAMQQLFPANTTTIYEGTAAPTVVTVSKAEAGRKLSCAEVYAANADAVVGIVTQKTTNVWGQQVASASAGSGFVLTQDGYIVTNAHVIEDATSISVQFKNGDKYAANLVGREEDNDVAVLKIDATGLTPVRLGASADMVVGEEVVAIGNPLGEMTFSETHGIVSALDKALTMSDGNVINVLQTDAAINSGNSGGPLFNMYGQVIGITNAKYSNNGSSGASIEGIGFAIPIDDVKEMLTDLIEHGYVTGKPYAGVTLATVNAQSAAQYGRSGGAYVQSVVPNGPAARAGLKKGDIIFAIDGEEIAGHQDFIAIRDRHKAGDTVTLSVDREARTVTLTLTFGEQTPSDQTGPVVDREQSGSGGQGSQSYGYGYFNPFDWFGW